MKVWQNIAFAIHNRTNSERKKRIAEMAALVGLKGLLHRYPAELSGGQARRAALARALAGQQELILMDEPLTNLDKRAAAELLDCIAAARIREEFHCFM